MEDSIARGRQGDGWDYLWGGEINDKRIEMNSKRMWEELERLAKRDLPERWRELDPRVSEAILEVPRHEHVVGDFKLGRIYSNSIRDLDDPPADERQILEWIAEDFKLPFEAVAETKLGPHEFNMLRFHTLNRRRATLSEPFLMAVSLQAVLPEGLGRDGQNYKALDIGCGTGYGSRLLRMMGFEVEGVEIKPNLVEIAQRVCKSIDSLNFHAANGGWGWPEGAPYDAIVVGAQVRDPGVILEWLDQLKHGGKMVVPQVVSEDCEEIEIAGKTFRVPTMQKAWLRVYTKSDEDVWFEDILRVGFVGLR